MASNARSSFQPGQHVQVNIEGLLEPDEKFGAATGIAARIVQIDPVSQKLTVVLLAPIGGKHSLTVPANRVRASN